MLATGLRAWVVQRFSAVYLAGFVFYALAALALRTDEGHDAWRAWLAEPVHWIATLVFIVALLMHAWVGMRDVLLDYVRPLALRLLLLAVVGLVLGFSGLLAFHALLGVAA